MKLPILGALCLALIVLLALTFVGGREERLGGADASAQSKVGKKFIDGYEESRVASIAITGAEGKIDYHLALAGSKWTVTTPASGGDPVPANQAEVRKILDSLAALHAGRVASSAKEHHGKLGVDGATGRRVVVRGTDGKNLADFWCGKGAVDLKAAYVRAEGSDVAYQAVETTTDEAPAKVGENSIASAVGVTQSHDTRFFENDARLLSGVKYEDLREARLEWRRPDPKGEVKEEEAKPFTLRRERKAPADVPKPDEVAAAPKKGDWSAWKMADETRDVRADSDVSSLVENSILNGLKWMKLLKYDDAKLAEQGLAPGWLRVVLVAESGAETTVEFGARLTEKVVAWSENTWEGATERWSKVEHDGYFVRTSATDHVFVVEEWPVNSVRKKREDLLKPKEEPKKEEPKKEPEKEPEKKFPGLGD
ncbi:MAG: DUF4340 domain-containing protein [Planctomycetes bacterium]|nr:DUF4340 domain-containing protein [Planctomycetota bacterium]